MQERPKRIRIDQLFSNVPEDSGTSLVFDPGTDISKKHWELLRQQCNKLDKAISEPLTEEDLAKICLFSTQLALLGEAPEWDDQMIEFMTEQYNAAKNDDDVEGLLRFGAALAYVGNEDQPLVDARETALPPLSFGLSGSVGVENAALIGYEVDSETRQEVREEFDRRYNQLKDMPGHTQAIIDTASFGAVLRLLGEKPEIAAEQLIEIKELIQDALLQSKTASGVTTHLAILTATNIARTSSGRVKLEHKSKQDNGERGQIPQPKNF